ncbi:hypothetical protein ACHQM5_027188 [Ranunculus cassubicifolius]
MAKFLPYLLLLLLLTTIPIAFSSPSLPTIETDQQLHNIIEALTGSSDFGNWAGILSVSDPTTFPITATIFVPNDASVSSTNLSSFNASNILYHILPQQLTFENLLTQKIGSRLPTLLPNKSILVTNNSRLNFTIDDTLIVRPNLYMNGVVVVHGITSALNYSVYGDEHLETNPNPSPVPPSSSPVSETHMPGVISGENQTTGGGGGSSHSDAVQLGIEFPAAFVVLVAVLAFAGMLRSHILDAYQICALFFLIWFLLPGNFQVSFLWH